MSKRTYIQNYYPIRLFTVLILSCVLLGCIPAFQIIVQRNLIDSAIKGVSEGGSQNFLLYLSQFIALALLNSLLVNILQLGTNRHNRIVEKRLDTQRIEKCNKVSFPVTETQSFHELCEQAEKAAESDNAFFAALQTEIKSAIQILTSFL